MEVEYCRRQAAQQCAGADQASRGSNVEAVSILWAVRQRGSCCKPAWRLSTVRQAQRIVV